MLQSLTPIVWILGMACCSGPAQEIGVPLSEEEFQARGPVQHDDFVVNAIPKCGTHLIMNCLHWMLNKSVDEGYDYVTEEQYTPDVARKYSAFIQSLKGKPFIHKTHVPFYQNMENTFLEAGMKWIFCIRDPRDAVVSLVFYLENRFGDQRDFMSIDSAIYDPLTIDQKIEAVLTGSCCTNYMATYLKPFVGWTKSSQGLTIRFEDLIGPQGGGQRDSQIQAIKQIASYLHVTLSEQEIRRIAVHTNSFSTPIVQNALGTSYTLGQTGNWRLFFNDANKNLFKELFGTELIQLGYEPNGHW